MNKKIMLAAALVGASVGVQAEQTTQVVYPYGVPFAYAPVAPVQLEINEELVKAYVEYQQKAYQHFLAYQQQERPAQRRKEPRPGRRSTAYRNHNLDSRHSRPNLDSHSRPSPGRSHSHSGGSRSRGLDPSLGWRSWRPRHQTYR